MITSVSKFPQDAEDKTIVELPNGLFYQFNKRDNTWVRVDGFSISMDLATVLRDGLMSKEDLQKLNGLLIPPPQTALTSGQCNLTFDSGTFGFRSSKDHLFVEHELNLRNRDPQGFEVDDRQVWRIHENTYGINFRVNVNRLVDILEQRGQLTYNRSMGPVGPKGFAGEDGIDNLETGPKGQDGPDGANVEFDGTLTQRRDGFLAGEGNRGIIDVRMDEREDGNFIIVTRSIIGNPELCPRLVEPDNIDTKWVVAIDERPPERIVLDECDPTLCGNNLDCSRDVSRSLIQTFCSTRLYFIDFSLIEQTIEERFRELVDLLKETKQQITLELMKAMIDLFTQQKLALCCAIENCQSRRENQRHRNIIDTARIQAAQAGFSIEVDGEQTRNYLDTNSDKDCPPDEQQQEAIENEQIPEGATAPTGTDVTAPEPEPDFPRFVTFNGNGTIVTGNTESNPRETTIQNNSLDLPEGNYQARFTQLDPPPGSPSFLSSCCFFTGTGVGQGNYESLKNNPQNVGPGFEQIIESMEPYNRRFRFFWQGPNGEQSFEHPDTGNFTSCDSCFSTSQQSSEGFDFEHAGGPIRFEYVGGSFERNKFDNFMITVDGRQIPFGGGHVDAGSITLELAREPEPEPEPITQDRKSCDPFESDVTVSGRTNSLKITRQQITEVPSTFETVEVSGGSNVSEVQLQLPSSGTYEIKMVSAGIFNATIVGTRTRVPGEDPPVGDWYVVEINGVSHSFFLLDGDELISSQGVRQIDDPGVSFFGGYLVTKDMYDAVIDGNAQRFVQALEDSSALVLADPFYRGLLNPVFRRLRSFNVDDLMEAISQLKLYDSSSVSVTYEGFVDQFATGSQQLAVSFEDSGGFVTQQEDIDFYEDKALQISVSEESTIRLFVDARNLADPDNALSGPVVLPNVSPNEGSAIMEVRCVQSQFTGCEEPLITARLDCKFRNREPNALLVDLEPNDYVLTISDCCCLGQDGFFGIVALKYQASGGIETLLTNADLGRFEDETEAVNNYLGSSFSFSHAGGDVKIWIPERVNRASANTHLLEIQIQTVDCFNQQEVLGTAVTAEDEEIFGEFSPCDMSLDHINFYESGWKNRSACASHLTVGGIQWLVVKRSIGTDLTCGGGESEETACIREGLDAGFHPAVAFPTLDGKLFFGKPTGGFQRMFRDEVLENVILAQIRAGDVIESVNNPTDNIEAIIFPLDI